MLQHNEPAGTMLHEKASYKKILYDSAYMRYLEKLNLRDRQQNGACKGWGRGNEELLFNGNRVLDL